MVEGGPSADFQHVKTMLYRRPDLLHRILDVNAARGHGLSQRADRSRRAGRHDLRHLGRLARSRRVSRVLPRLHAAGARRPRARTRRDARADHRVHERRRRVAREHRRERAATRSDSTGRSHIGAARERVGAHAALQGNLEPAMLLAEPATHPREAWRACSRITVAAAATCSIWGTACRSSHRRKTWEFWSKPCTSLAGRITENPRQFWVSGKATVSTYAHFGATCCAEWRSSAAACETALQPFEYM